MWRSNFSSYMPFHESEEMTLSRGSDPALFDLVLAEIANSTVITSISFSSGLLLIL